MQCGVRFALAAASALALGAPGAWAAAASEESAQEACAHDLAEDQHRARALLQQDRASAAQLITAELESDGAEELVAWGAAASDGDTTRAEDASAVDTQKEQGDRPRRRGGPGGHR
mmetsp:Transcript_144221/g.401890  ORF Transcript_144221/g.401890 Transcript_144221/m.401890 type:complete len:116 (+) Transcript_144221:110-457(+)